MGRRDHALIALLLLAGLRNGELVMLRVADVDLDAGTLYVANGKGGRDRYVILAPKLATILREYLATTRPALAPTPDTGMLFPHARQRRDHRAGQALLTRSIWAVVRRKVVAIAGREAWPHLLRHSYAVRLRMAGAPLELIKEQLGHSRLDTTLIYANVPSDHHHKQIAKYLK